MMIATESRPFTTSHYDGYPWFWCGYGTDVKGDGAIEESWRLRPAALVKRSRKKK
jgi:hypothetical protein